MKDSEIQKTIDSAYEYFEGFQKKIQGSGYDQKYAQMMLGAADDPDEEFLARKLLQMTSLFDEIGNMVRYLHKPVKKDGKIARVAGKYYISGEEIPTSCTLEFMQEGKWYIGKIKENNSTNEYSLISEDQKITCINPHETKVRIR